MVGTDPSLFSSAHPEPRFVDGFLQTKIGAATQRGDRRSFRAAPFTTAPKTTPPGKQGHYGKSEPEVYAAYAVCAKQTTIDGSAEIADAGGPFTPPSGPRRCR